MACFTGGHHTICLSNDGVVHSFGHNFDGQLGLGLVKRRVYVPHPILELPKIIRVACGYNFTVCIDFQGKLWSFGENNYGQLGIGNKLSYATPQKIRDIPPIKYVSCGREHTLIITEDLDLWSVGRNNYGQLCLGNNQKEDQLKPVPTSFSNVSKISVGASHSLFQSTDGIVYGCGYNFHGPSNAEENQWEIIQIPNQPANITQFCCGSIHALFLDADGKVFLTRFSENCNLGNDSTENYIQLDHIPNIPFINYIYCAELTYYLIDEDENLWSFGSNDNGKLGRGDDDNQSFINQPILIESINNIQQVSDGWSGSHVLVQDNQNKIFAFGKNNYGQLGIYKLRSSIPVEIDSEYFSIWGDRKIANYQRAKSARK